jgi:hypothetical protein
MDVEQSAATIASPSIFDKDKQPIDPSLDEERSIGHGENDVLGGENVDAVLAAKMSLVNDVSSKTCHRRVARACLSGRPGPEVN